MRAADADLARAQDDLKSLSIEILERYEETSLIYRLTERLAETVEAREIGAVLLREVAAVLGARQGEVWLGQGGQASVAASLPGTGPLAEDEPEALAVLAHGRSWVREATAGREPMLSVPLAARTGAPVGALVLRGRSGGRGYGSVELKLLASLGTLASAFIRNGELLAEVRRTDAQRRDDAIAREVHQGLLPKSDPIVPGLDLAGGCLAAGNVGGDYYGWLPDAPASVGLVVADVSGHGVGAALVMAAAKGALRAEWRATRSPSALLAGANALLVPDLSDADLFVTAFVARLSARHLVGSSAGHPPALVVRPCGDVVPLASGGPALGVMEEAVYDVQEIELAPGDVLVAYTDGLVETRGPGRRAFDVDGVVAAVRSGSGLSAASLRQQILEAAAAHRAGAPLQDDVTLVVARVTG
ncbi:MAG TPA: PP2C family protein-serine/threonine phosphatase [Candidatus Polarisedimenticolaceae bacterium]|nr:PP2C family protein-serine/threonine phosphatase [Candidatus Polarisedimenticolaceae bacterium]